MLEILKENYIGCKARSTETEENMSLNLCKLKLLSQDLQHLIYLTAYSLIFFTVNHLSY